VPTTDDLPRDPSGHHLIHVQVAMESLRSSEVLRTMRNKRKNKDTPEAEALWSGYWQLRNRSHEMIDYALRLGQLLFCFPETTVLQQGGAA